MTNLSPYLKETRGITDEEEQKILELIQIFKKRVRSCDNYEEERFRRFLELQDPEFRVKLLACMKEHVQETNLLTSFFFRYRNTHVSKRAKTADVGKNRQKNKIHTKLAETVNKNHYRPKKVNSKHTENGDQSQHSKNDNQTDQVEEVSQHSKVKKDDENVNTQNQSIEPTPSETLSKEKHEMAKQDDPKVAEAKKTIKSVRVVSAHPSESK